MSEQTQQLRTLATISYLALTGWVVLWQFLWQNDESYSLLFRLLWIVPLLFPLVGIIKGKAYTHAWSNFIVLIYLIHGLTMVYALESQRWLAVVEIVLACASLGFCSYYARKRGQEQGLGLKKLSQVMEEERQRFEDGKP